jgi:predicted transcriptional regulator
MIKSLENLYDYTQDNAYAMSPEDIKELQESVRRGVQDMEAGRVTPHEEVMKRYH